MCDNTVNIRITVQQVMIVSVYDYSRKVLQWLDHDAEGNQ